MIMCIRAHIRRTVGSFGSPTVLVGIALVVSGLAASSPVFAGDPTNRVFTNGFETRLAGGGNDILLKPIATTDPTCPENGRTDIDIRPGTPVRFCYRLENHSDVTLDEHEIVSSTFGLLYQGNVSIAPGESVVIEDPGSPRLFEHRTIDLVDWETSGGGRFGAEHRTTRINIAPDLELFRFLATNTDECVAGIQPRNPDWAVSGYTALTVSPGDLVTHCFRARNASISETGTILTDNALTDSLFGQLLDHDSQSFENLDVYTVAVQGVATTSMELDAQWSASDGMDTVSAEGHSSLYVSSDPACDGIRQGTSYDYVYEIFGIQMVTNIRLDFEVNASAARPGEPMTVHAHGAITSLQPDGAFGPRQDTRVYLSIPAGIDLQRPFEAHASINDGVPISAGLDVAGRILVLSTGRVSGAPAEIDLNVTGYIAPTWTQPISWSAPKMQMDIEGDTGAIVLLEVIPDRRGPPVLTTPLCIGR